VKKFLILASMFLLTALPARAAQSAFAPEASPVAVAPIVDTFEDGAQRLRLVGLPSSNGASLEVTLVYEDADLHVRRSVTIDPALVTTTNAAVYNEFLNRMDPDFVSFVRASLGDRLLHLRTAKSDFERAESALFFPNANRGAAEATDRAE
jgi:hypothetical protein